ncbi:efflux RND transporter permease subunit [Enterobacter hormaechei]
MLAFGFGLICFFLLAMVLAIGLVVDDAIVVVENVHRHIEEDITSAGRIRGGARWRGGYCHDHHFSRRLRANRSHVQD